uniref:Selenoprotein M n=1 Tax=Plectus sambesii TaxID=2011161 RepID=A0A914X4R2_9BILA
MMKISLLLLLPLMAVVVIASTEEASVASARVESCSGCSLNRLHEVKRFIMEDLEKYENTVFKSIHGRRPELILLDAQDNEIDRIELSDKSREQCNELLTSRGFRLKSPEGEELKSSKGDEL